MKNERRNEMTKLDCLIALSLLISLSAICVIISELKERAGKLKDLVKYGK